MCLNLMGHLCLRSHQHSVPISITWQGQTERPLFLLGRLLEGGCFPASREDLGVLGR